MKKKYVLPEIKHNEYFSKEDYAQITVPGFTSVEGEKPAEDSW